MEGAHWPLDWRVLRTLSTVHSSPQQGKRVSAIVMENFPCKEKKLSAPLKIVR